MVIRFVITFFQLNLIVSDKIWLEKFPNHIPLLQWKKNLYQVSHPVVGADEVGDQARQLETLLANHTHVNLEWKIQAIKK